MFPIDQIARRFGFRRDCVEVAAVEFGDPREQYEKLKQRLQEGGYKYVVGDLSGNEILARWLVRTENDELGEKTAWISKKGGIQEHRGVYCATTENWGSLPALLASKEREV